MLKKTGIVLFVFLFALAGCSNSSSDGLQSISPAEAYKLMNSQSNVLVVDVRSPQELKQGHIKNSLLIPLWDIMKGKRSLPKDRPLLLVCAVGGRSYGLGQALVKNGWKDVFNLSGGIASWKRAGLPLEY